MISESIVDAKTGRKLYLSHPDKDGEVTFILSLHGGGSFGAWQRLYFPAEDFVDSYSLVVATPTAATEEPMRHWVADADDEHLRNVVDLVLERFDVASFWLAGHSQGGMTSRRLLQDGYFADRVDGFLSLSGGRFGQAPIVEGFGPPRAPGQERPPFRLEPPPLPDTDLSFIYATGEHEIQSLPETSPWAEKYNATSRERRPDIVDTEPGKTYDKLREGRSSKSWGLLPRPGTAEVFVYTGAEYVIADVVRKDKGHTEGLEPKVTEELVKLIVRAPGGKARVTAQ